MVAGPDACFCPHCDTVCKGRFAGCAGVWARGPREVTVRVPPSEEPFRRSRSTSTIDAVVAADAVATVEEVLLDKLVDDPARATARSRRLDQQRREEHALDEHRADGHPADEHRADERPPAVDHLIERVHQLETTVASTTAAATAAASAAAAAAAAAKAPRAVAVDDRTAAVVGQLVDKVRQLETAAAAAAEVDAKLPRPAPVRPADNARVEAVAKAVGGLAAGLDRLAAEVSELRKVPGRLDQLERQRSSTTGTASDTRRDQAVERLAGDLARLSGRVGELTATVGRTASQPDERVVRLAERVKGLEAGQARREAVERSRPVPSPTASNVSAMVARLEQRTEELSARLAPLDSLADQVRALASAEPTDTQVADRVERLATQVEDLASAVHSGRSSTSAAPVQQGQGNAIEKTVGELMRSTERLSARVSDLDEVPKRLQALEAVEHPPVEKVLGSLGKRLDRLSTQVGDLKGVPDRLRALEEEPLRAESLTRGLGGAIDMIDQLSAQVTAIQDADRAGNGSPG